MAVEKVLFSLLFFFLMFKCSVNYTLYRHLGNIRNTIIQALFRHFIYTNILVEKLHLIFFLVRLDLFVVMFYLQQFITFITHHLDINEICKFYNLCLFVLNYVHFR